MTYNLFKTKLKMLNFRSLITNTYVNKRMYIHVRSASNIIISVSDPNERITFNSYTKALNFIINIDK